MPGELAGIPGVAHAPAVNLFWRICLAMLPAVLLWSPMRFLTDFADEAVVLPMIATVASVLGLLGWRRGALAWMVSVGASFASVLVLKLVFSTCGPALGFAGLRSPSGHTVAAAVIAGGIAVEVGLGRWYAAGAAVLAAVVIGCTRLALGAHTPVEAVLGGALGVLGVLGFAMLAGPAPVLRLRWLFASVIAMAMLLHGMHLDVESQIRALAFRFPFCQLNQVGDAASGAPGGASGATTGGGIRPDDTAVSDHGVIISRATAGVIRRGP